MIAAHVEELRDSPCDHAEAVAKWVGRGLPLCTQGPDGQSVTPISRIRHRRPTSGGRCQHHILHLVRSLAHCRIPTDEGSADGCPILPVHSHCHPRLVGGLAQVEIQRAVGRG
ncbi:MAG: hypothetical protein BWY79_01153 [Actinobacteria bacterium ADurb.Bin444]|nr:MAG: hypothetical protein BWY79_01153 [Actinobacteria bacterium ADurb.Bin444]